MNYRTRLLLLILMDSLIVSTAIFIASWIAYPYEPVIHTSSLIISAIALLVFHHLFAVLYNLYKKVWSYASVGELTAIVKAITLSIIGTGIVQFLVNDFEIYKRALLVTWMLHVILIGGSRFIWRVLRDRYIFKSEDKKRTLIIGAGSTGAMIVRQIKDQQNAELLAIGFIDDNRSKQKMQLYNLPVLGSTKDIESVIKNHKIEHVIIAIPTLRKAVLHEIVTTCNKLKVEAQIIPKMEDLMTGKVSVNQLKNVEVEDLLGREPVELDIQTISEYVTGNTVLITGAGGSIGSELCRQLMRFTPKKIVLVGQGEYSIYSIDMELREKYRDVDIDIIPLIGNVQDRARMFDIVEKTKPTIIYHAAAHKHVPLMEYNPHEAVKNNIIGTKNVAEAADTFGVNTFVLVSSDKAVNPTNVMGATKRVAEMVIQDLNTRSKTNFVAVRFGNVLGSRGSVIPLFKKQIRQGGPITITDPEMTRYFMTIPEASRLVIQAGALAKGGEIFVLDMGEPVKIVDLARNLIHLSGYTEEDIPIEFTGIRPGEKMFEELLSESEVHPGEVYEKIYVGRTTEVNPMELLHFISQFESLSNEGIKKELMQIVSTKSIKSAIEK
ncbi:NDP-sugar epimerase, includes UDP-GlcNAc-inverting 4,6-dehydratase FlaA1 and capsular polysaccharide biosynthesis protein EpsC [Oceanobacillus limi]|uniref:NDP-sugar epimerase, includes UDP-GlcNAc-inverting 4,6-dehydratase FlaA1 and capsular polysaccharide biosynthesis protein EpsC n=1 Tax=Oceanobacillus limi TaxID=930131 RepID=A0A1I0A4H8_9BACI|nr:nucleoside-diphosphate sugar epimerase/dehydratase [Oceanobacillus limi]SES88585.1 NDP-sugar epimerase, includes UDP-GlcNAc-inverting 4,6-dehydratase FlaA1 and capsular polysaccharide biosynthesis protein EpsC [Oceanobacillus limi]